MKHISKGSHWYSKRVMLTLGIDTRKWGFGPYVEFLEYGYVAIAAGGSSTVDITLHVLCFGIIISFCRKGSSFK